MNDSPGPAPEPPQPPPEPPRIPGQRYTVENGEGPLPPPELPPAPTHQLLKSLLGAWALAACTPLENARLEEHLGECGPCAEEALRLREAVWLLRPAEALDLDPGLRSRTLASALEHRPPRIPLPRWAEPFDAEAARLDALLQDIAGAEWHTQVELRWFSDDAATKAEAPSVAGTTVSGVLAHLLAVDGLVARALGLPDPLDPASAEGTPAARTEALWHLAALPQGAAIRRLWRTQSQELVRTVAFAGGSSGRLPVSYGEGSLPLCDALLDRAFACWVHAGDIADAVAYPYPPPAPRHLQVMVDLAARQLPAALAARREAGRGRPVAVGSTGRSLRLEVEGAGGGQWLIPLDVPGAAGPPGREVAHMALDSLEFCRLVAGRLPPLETVAGQHGDRGAIREVLFATASLSRM